jgi:hypothetical protein
MKKRNQLGQTAVTIKKLLDEGNELEALILANCLLEYMGAFFDEYPFEKAGLSEKRIHKALKILFRDSFYKHKHYIYKVLRANAVHSMQISTEKNFDIMLFLNEIIEVGTHFSKNASDLNIIEFKLKRLIIN